MHFNTKASVLHIRDLKFYPMHIIIRPWLLLGRLAPRRATSIFFFHTNEAINFALTFVSVHGSMTVKRYRRDRTRGSVKKKLQCKKKANADGHAGPSNSSYIATL